MNATVLWVIAAILVIVGIVQLIQGQWILGLVLIVVGLLVGPGGVSIFSRQGTALRCRPPELARVDLGSAGVIRATRLRLPAARNALRAISVSPDSAAPASTPPHQAWQNRIELAWPDHLPEGDVSVRVRRSMEGLSSTRVRTVRRAGFRALPVGGATRLGLDGGAP